LTSQLPRSTLALCWRPKFVKIDSPPIFARRSLDLLVRTKLTYSATQQRLVVDRIFG